MTVYAYLVVFKIDVQSADNKEEIKMITRHLTIKLSFFVLSTVGSLILTLGSAHGATFTWTGGAGSGSNWYDTNNWLGGSVPSDGTLIRTTNSADVVIFDSETASSMPGTVTTYQSWTGSTTVGKMPQVRVLNGTVAFSGTQNWGWSGIDTFTVGDNNALTSAAVNVGFSNLNRDPDGTKTYVVNSDGTFNVTNTGNIKFSDSSAKETVVRLLGGAFILAGNINSNLTDDPGDYISFEELGSVFTADFGGQLPDLTTIEGQYGDSFRIGGSLASNPLVSLVTTDNGDGTFTITTNIPEPSTAILAALGLMGVCFRRRK